METNSFLKRKTFLVSQVVIVFLLLSLTSAQAMIVYPPPATETLRIHQTTYPDILDPQKASFVNEISHINLIYEGLTRIDSNSETLPAAAQSWTYSADARQITFTLRPGLTYSDGSLLNAKRFEYAILRTIDPTTAGEYGSIFDMITGAANYRTANLATVTPAELAALRAAVDVHALDANASLCVSYNQADCLKLRIGFAAPSSYFHTLGSMWVLSPVKEEIINSTGNNWWQLPQNHVGNGPFVATQLNSATYSEFVPNPNYWRTKLNYNIRMFYIPDSLVAFDQYKNGDLDIITPDIATIALIKADPQLSSQLRQYSGTCTYALMFQNGKPPFNDPKVREAFAYAFDRDGFVHDVLADAGLPTLTWIPPGVPGYKAGETRFGYNPTKALEALSQSSYHNAENLPPIVLTFSDSPRNRTRWEWIAAHWQAIFGIAPILEPVEPTLYTARTKTLETSPLTFILGWCGDYPDPQNYLSVYWRTGGFGARIYYSNPAVDALLDQADATVDPATRMSLYNQAQDKIIDDVPAAFAWTSIQTYLVSPRIKWIAGGAFDTTFMGASDPTRIWFTLNKVFLPGVKK
jgi:oligopeptide transport system substrate-binding protein